MRFPVEESKEYRFIFKIICVQKTEARTCSNFPGLQSNFKQLGQFNGFKVKGIERRKEGKREKREGRKKRGRERGRGNRERGRGNRERGM